MHPASNASLKNPSDTECLEAASESLICDSQYDVEDKMLYVFLLDRETSEAGVSLFPWLLVVLRTSDIGVMLPTNFRAGLTVLVGIDSLLGGLVDLSLADRSRTPTLLLTLDTDLLPLKLQPKFD